MKSGKSPCLYEAGRFLGAATLKEFPVYVKEFAASHEPGRAPRAPGRADREPRGIDHDRRRDRPRAPDRRSRRADRAAWITNNGRRIDSRKAWKTSHSRAATADEQRRRNRRSRTTDRGSRITYSEHRSRARGSWSRSQARPGGQIAQANGARAWRSSTSSYPGTLARIYQAHLRAARLTIQASPGEIPPGKKKGLRRALSWSPGDVLED